MNFKQSLVPLNWQTAKYPLLAGTLLISSFVSGCAPVSNVKLDAVAISGQTTGLATDFSQPSASLLTDGVGQLHSAPEGDSLEFKVRLPQESFKTQSVNFNEIKYLRLWVRGLGIADRVYNEKGYVPMEGSLTSTLAVTRVPRGKNRVVAVQGYDSNQQPIPGAFLVGYYSSPDTPGNVQVHLKWRFYALGRILENLLDNQPALLQNFNPEALQTALDKIIYGAGPVEGNTYAVHPSRLDVSGIATSIIANGGIPETLATDFKPVDNTTTFHVRTPQGTNFNIPLTLRIEDPSSTVVTIPAGVGQVTVNKIAIGTWKARVTFVNGGTTTDMSADVVVGKDGSVTLTKGTAGDPVLFPPVISSISGNTGGTALNGVVSWWKGESNANDVMAANHGALQNGTNFAAGKFGQAFQLNGTNQFVSLAAAANGIPMGNGHYTLSAWIKPNTTGSRSVMSWGNFGGGNQVNAFRLNGANQLMNYWWANDLLLTSGDLSGAWHHVVASFDGTTRKMFVDGLLIGNDAPGAGHNVTTANNFRIGSSNGGEFFDGLLDEVQVYNRALTGMEIQMLKSPDLRTFVINGDGFNPVRANNTVLINGQPAYVADATATKLTVTLPDTMTGKNLSVVVQNGGLQSKPALYDASPALGALPAPESPGRSITLSGAGFEPGSTTVKINGVDAAVTGSTANSLTVTLPMNASSGPISVTTSAGTVTSTSNYTVAMRWIRSTTQATNKVGAEYLGRWRHESVVFDNKMWIIAGNRNCVACASNDIWSSTDGVTWTEVFANNSYADDSHSNPASPTTRFRQITEFASLVFNNKIWWSGGYNYGTRRNDVWSSTDGSNWLRTHAHVCCGGNPSTASPDGRFGRRAQHRMVTFNGKMWVVGGHNDGIGGRYTDVWSSTDGSTWTQETANAGWGDRSYFGLAVFNNKLWLTGGVTGSDCCGLTNKNDVWSSADGVTWTQEVAAAPWSARHSHTSLVFNNKLWIIGGTVGGDEVWSSPNGVTWTKETLATPSFGARNAHTSLVYNNRLWIIGGSSPDVWYTPEF